MWEDTQEVTKVPCCSDSGLWRMVMRTWKLIFTHRSELSVAGELGAGEKKENATDSGGDLC